MTNFAPPPESAASDEPPASQPAKQLRATSSQRPLFRVAASTRTLEIDLEAEKSDLPPATGHPVKGELVADLTTHGVVTGMTGSGKTEIYIRAAQEAIRRAAQPVHRPIQVRGAAPEERVVAALDLGGFEDRVDGLQGRRWAAEMARFAGPLAIAFALVGWYNYIRFDPITVPLLTASLLLAAISSEMLPASLETVTLTPQAGGSRQMAASKKMAISLLSDSIIFPSRSSLQSLSTIALDHFRR